MSVSKILFVCTGNTCRSPMAEALLKQMLKKEGLDAAEVWSRGVSALNNQPISAGAADALRAIGVDSAAHRSARVLKEDVERADLILVMEARHRELLNAAFPSLGDKIFLLKSYADEDRGPDIDDPIGGSPSDYEKCRIEIQNCLLGLVTKLKSSKEPS